MQKARKQKSISSRLTWFYSLALVLLILGLFLFLYSILSRSSTNLSRPILESAVSDVANELEYEDDILYIGDDVELFQDGVNILLYKSDQQVILGTLPNQFPETSSFENARHRVIRSIDGEIEWNVYDIYYQAGNSGIWIRGIYSLDSANTFLRNTMLILMGTFPIFILLVLVIGYLITKRTLKPLENLTRSISEIRAGKDLETRIPISKKASTAPNEIDLLASQFNSMLDRLEKQFAAERQFTSDASHELRTPIAAILSQAGAGLMEGSSPQDKEHALERIQFQAEIMQNLTNQLMELSRADRGSFDLYFEKIQFSELCEVVFESLEDRAKASAIHFHKQITAGIELIGDEVLLMRLVINLLSNSIKYGKAGGYVSLDLNRDENFALLSVTDNGIGISEEHLPFIFDRFYRVNKARSRNAKEKKDYSAGLGLSMVAWIVDVHEGSIDVQSTENVGTQFLVRLPLVRDDSQ